MERLNDRKKTLRWQPPRQKTTAIASRRPRAEVRTQQSGSPLLLIRECVSAEFHSGLRGRTCDQSAPIRPLVPGAVGTERGREPPSLASAPEIRVPWTGDAPSSSAGRTGESLQFARPSTIMSRYAIHGPNACPVVVYLRSLSSPSRSGACCWAPARPRPEAGRRRAPRKPERDGEPNHRGHDRREYLRPAWRGGTGHFGGLAPFGEVWRSGANEAATASVSPRFVFRASGPNPWTTRPTVSATCGAASSSGRPPLLPTPRDRCAPHRSL
jgi:hypothetical protein